MIVLHRVTFTRDVVWLEIGDWLNKLYPNSTSEGQNGCAFPRDLLYFHGTFYTRLAERVQTDNISSHWSHARSRENLNGLDWVPCSRNISCYDWLNAVIKSCYFLVSYCSLHFGSFCGEKSNLQRVYWAYFFCKFCSGLFFSAQTKKSWVVLHVFQYCSSKAWEYKYLVPVFLRKMSCNSQISKQNYCFEWRLISLPLSKIS